MSEVGFLEKLLDGAAVEWVPLGEVCKVFNGCAFSSEYFNTTREGLPLIRIRDVNTGFSETYYSGEYDNRYLVKDGNILIGMDGDFRAVKWKYGPALLNQRVCRLQNFSENVRPDFLFYLVQDELDRIHGTIQGSTVKHLSSKELERSIIPLPSVAIQAEIVRILDAFTELTAELTAELGARKKQYKHYRDQLLSFDGKDVEWKTLGEVSLKSYSGATPKAGTAKYYDDGTIPWLRTQEVVFTDIHETAVKITQTAVDETAAKWVPANCVIVAISGATAARSGINKIPLTTNQHCCCLEIDPKQALYRYVFHWVSMNYEKLRDQGQGARGDLNSGIIKDFKIPIPFSNEREKSLAEQARIVAILDRFDTLTSSLSEGLPREIALRQKQYEYYRDLLLNFPKPAEVAP